VTIPLPWRKGTSQTQVRDFERPASLTEETIVPDSVADKRDGQLCRIWQGGWCYLRFE
jgi:hypothetical protein